MRYLKFCLAFFIWSVMTGVLLADQTNSTRSINLPLISGRLENTCCVKSMISTFRNYPGPLYLRIGIEGFTNITLYKPIPKQAILFSLTGEDGKEVHKTTLGNSFGSELNPDKELLDGSWKASLATQYGHPRKLIFNYCYANHSEWIYEFNKLFIVKSPGKYKLRVQIRLFTQESNQIFQPYILPTTEKTLDIIQRDIDGLIH